ELKTFTEGVAAGDERLIDDGEGRDSGSLSGEQYRAQLKRARAEGEIKSLKGMPWGVGSCFAALPTFDSPLPAVVFAARDREDKRHWRAVYADGTLLSDDLNMLRLADPGEAPRADMPADMDL